MRRRRLLGAVASAGLTGSMTGCLGGGGGQTPTDQQKQTPTGQQQQIAKTFNVFSWYENWHAEMLEKFRKKSERLETTNLTAYGSNQELFSKLKAAGTSGTDFVIPSNNMLIKLRKQDMIEPIDTSLISRWDMQKEVANQKPWKNFIKAEGKTWGVPFTQGFFWNITRKKKIENGTVSKDLINSWDLYFSDTDARLGIKDFGRRNVSIVIWHLRGDKADINEDPGNAVSWDKIEDKLVEMIENSDKIYSNSEVARQLIKKDQVDVVNSWGGEVIQLENLSGVKDVKGFFPKEGSNGWFDSFAIPKNAKHAYTSHKYMDFLLKPENQVKEIQIEGNLAVQPGLVEKLPSETREKFAPILTTIQEHGTKLQPYAPDKELQNRATQAWNRAKSRAG